MVESFREPSPSWIPDIETALAEIQESFEEGKISIIALDEQDLVLGWVGANHSYAKVWELHPLVVRLSHQGRGIGRLLVQELERRVREKGAVTLRLGTDDLVGTTSLYGIDLYPNVWEHMAHIQNIGDHAFGFYQKIGFTIIGIVPDANGFGKPDILMAKRLGD
ncbi:GNAT family N-acetyltransferase [Chloroflexi bacterium TSY]|nr:GNAT family N-acetyltransferase [Chloroflexi bacterium TSY]